MSLDKAIYVPLFTETSVSVDSPFFTIIPGEIAMLQAFGFADYASREDSTTLQVPQEACLESLLFRESVLPSHKFGVCQIMDLEKYRTELLAKETVCCNGNCFTLTASNNIMLINIPGTYRLVMNDGTAVGQARVYMRVFTKDEFIWDSKFFLDGGML